MKKYLSMAIFAGFFFTALVCSGLPKSTAAEIAGPFFEPDKSGRNITLTVMDFKGERLRDRDEYLVDMIQGSLREYIGRFSEITIKNYNETEISETASDSHHAVSHPVTAAAAVNGDDESDDESAETAHPVTVYHYSYTMTGRIIANSDHQFRLAFNVTDSKSGEVVADYNNPAVEIQQIRSGKAMQEAVKVLLGRMKVVLTEAGVLALDLDGHNSVEAQTKLARSRIAGRSGNYVESVINAYGAADRNASLTEAEEQLKTAIKMISTDNTSLEIQTDYQQWQEWDKQLRDFEKYFRDFHPFEVIYTQPQQSGNTNYSAATVDLEFFIGMQPSAELPIMQKVLRLLISELNKTKNRKKWNFDEWPQKFMEYNLYQVRKFIITFGLYNDSNREINRGTVELQTQLVVKNNKIVFDSIQRLPFKLKDVRVSDLGENFYIKFLSINNGLSTIDMNEAEDGGYWIVKQTDFDNFPKGKTPTISKGDRKITSSSSAVIAPVLPNKLIPDPALKYHRMGVNLTGLFYHLPPGEFANSSLSAGFTYGYSVLTVEAGVGMPFSLFSKKVEDVYYTSIGAGAGATWVTQYVLPTLTLGANAVIIEGGALFVPYCHLRVDLITSGDKGFGFRLGYLMEAGFPQKNKEGCENYFRGPLYSGEKFIMSGKISAGFVFWFN